MVTPPRLDADHLAAAGGADALLGRLVALDLGHLIPTLLSLPVPEGPTYRSSSLPPQERLWRCRSSSWRTPTWGSPPVRPASVPPSASRPASPLAQPSRSQAQVRAFGSPKPRRLRVLLP